MRYTRRTCAREDRASRARARGEVGSLQDDPRDAAGGGGRGDCCTSEAYEEYTFAGTVSFGVALSQVYRDSPRIIRTMGLSAAFPLLKYFEARSPPSASPSACLIPAFASHSRPRIYNRAFGGETDMHAHAR